MFCIIFCRWLDLNCGPLLYATSAAGLPTEPQPLLMFHCMHLSLPVLYFNVSLYLCPLFVPSTRPLFALIQQSEAFSLSLFLVRSVLLQFIFQVIQGFYLHTQTYTSMPLTVSYRPLHTFYKLGRVTRWLDYLLILGHFQQWKLAQYWPKKVQIFALHYLNLRLLKFCQNGEILPNLVTLTLGNSLGNTVTRWLGHFVQILPFTTVNSEQLVKVGLKMPSTKAAFLLVRFKP